MKSGDQRPLRIGISACFFHADPARPVFKGKPLYYIERSMARFVGSQGALPYMIPGPSEEPAATDLVPSPFDAYADDLDGLVLSGGVDMSPLSYGELPLRPEWSGDAARDAYEIGLVKAFVKAEKPVLGICRGQQVLNVAFGGTLFQDVVTQVPAARLHRDAEVYDRHFHEIAVEPGSALASLYGEPRFTVNSVHHQAVKDLGRDVRIEARSLDDGIIEAIRVEGHAFVRGVQWHPEFSDPKDATLLDNAPILREFLAEARRRRARVPIERS